MGLTADKNREEKRQIKLLPKEFFQPIFTMIYNNTAIKFTSQKELIALKIVSPEITQSEKANFDMVWELLKK